MGEKLHLSQWCSLCWGGVGVGGERKQQQLMLVQIRRMRLCGRPIHESFQYSTEGRGLLRKERNCESESEGTVAGTNPLARETEATLLTQVTVMRSSDVACFN